VKRKFFSTSASAAAILLAAGTWSVVRSAVDSAAIDGKDLRVEFDGRMHSRVIARFDGKSTVMGPFSASETISIDGAEVPDFALSSVKEKRVQDSLGAGKQTTLKGSSGSVEKTEEITVYDRFPRTAFYRVSYKNTGKSDVRVTGWTNNRYSIAAHEGDAEPVFWSYQSGSYQKRPDWVLPLKIGFKQDNYLGMNATDYGGGTPIVDVWRRDAGIGIGHIELYPKLVSMPVSMPDAQHAELGLKFDIHQDLKPGASLSTFHSFVEVHQRDYFQTLRDYSNVLQAEGVHFTPSPAAAFQPIWCAWGYGRTFVPSQVLGALPVVKKLGFTWVGVDDGWQSLDGDWNLIKTKFPNGDADMRKLVDQIHDQGFRAQLWWAPLAAKPDSDLVKNHPEMLLLNKDGSKQKISYWNDWYLCPANKQVIEYHRQLVIKMMRDWNYDGLKLDGQHMNGVPPCFNPAHHHKRPEESVEDLAAFFKMIYDTARSIKPDALVEFCPCGTAFNFYTLPNLNMTVASDPTSSWQVRSKGKSLKALHGDQTAYFGDHVELSDGHDDFASTVGVGGVVGTQFTWPVGSGPQPRPGRKGRRPTLDLTPEKEQVWQKWISLYKEKMLSKGQYRGDLYDIGFDRPETHAIAKDNDMYYAFFAPEYKGSVELRGLKSGSYKIRDYENNRDLGTVQGPTAHLNVDFSKHLLIEAGPQ
jgi:alpha-galactosidase